MISDLNKTRPEKAESNKKEKEPVLQTTPIYLQLREIVRHLIESGEFLPGTAIPSENELAETYGVHRITVRNAVDALVHEGMLKRIQGKGVFVVGSKIEQVLDDREGFVPAMDHPDMVVSIKENKKTLRLAGEKFADYFDINFDDEIFLINRIFFVGSTCIFHEDMYIPYDLLPKLNEIDTSVFTPTDIFAFYEIKLCGQRQTINIIQGDERIRKKLNIPDQVAILLMENTYQDQSGRNILYSKRWYRSDMISFRVRL